jgi:hypothetical protein
MLIPPGYGESWEALPAASNTAAGVTDDLSSDSWNSLGSAMADSSEMARDEPGVGEGGGHQFEEDSADADEAAPHALRLTFRPVRRAAVVGPAPPVVPDTPPSKAVNWQDMMLSGVMNPHLTSDTDVENVPNIGDPALNLKDRSRGFSCKWVGIDAFVDYVAQYSGTVVSAHYVKILRLCLSSFGSREEPLVLLGTLLGVLLSTNVVRGLLCKFIAFMLRKTA